MLFVGIFLGHFGFRIHPEVLHFFQEFGLVLFVYAVGMQVGPGFFSSFKKGGMRLNLLACGIVGLGALTALVIHYITGVPIPTMVGILSGAVTNTPGLGAAQQAYFDMHGVADESIALGSAVAYPLGVVGIILSTLLIKWIFGISLEKEEKQLEAEVDEHFAGAVPVSLVVQNPAIFGKTVYRIAVLLEHRDFVVSRISKAHTSKIEIASGETVLNEGDKIFVVTTEQDVEVIKTFIGSEIQMDRKQWIPAESKFVSRRILVTKPDMNGKRLGELQLRRLYGINVTRVNRAGVELVGKSELVLQIGDRITVVGSELAVDKVASLMGNSLKRLNEPNLITIFVGIALGVLLGSIPLTFPGIPQPVKLGLAGGPLVVSLLISRFGYRYKLITYTTQSANFMLREVGITIFLACVGLNAGTGFVDTIVNRGGVAWIGYGFIITMLPLLIVGCIGRYIYKLNYFTLMGLLAGSTTDPPALAYANTTAGNDVPAVGYATVYPLTMFLRVLTAQLIILFFCL